MKYEHLRNAEKRYQHLKTILSYMDTHAKEYHAIVSYAYENWDTMITNQEKGISIADQIEMGTDCPNYIAEEVETIVRRYKI